MPGRLFFVAVCTLCAGCVLCLKKSGRVRVTRRRHARRASTSYRGSTRSGPSSAKHSSLSSSRPSTQQPLDLCLLIMNSSKRLLDCDLTTGPDSDSGDDSEITLKQRLGRPNPRRSSVSSLAAPWSRRFRYKRHYCRHSSKAPRSPLRVPPNALERLQSTERPASRPLSKQ
jgi:hypothetical protein